MWTKWIISAVSLVGIALAGLSLYHQVQEQSLLNSPGSCCLKFTCQPDTGCCYPGSECCYPGSPCCDEECCGVTAVTTPTTGCSSESFCCPLSAKVACTAKLTAYAAKSPACTEKTDCCLNGEACCLTGEACCSGAKACSLVDAGTQLSLSALK